MSEEQIQALINAVKSDTALQERLKSAPDLDTVVAIAKEAGFVVTKEELKTAQRVELSDEELESVVAGMGGYECCGLWMGAATAQRRVGAEGKPNPGSGA